MKWKVVLSFAMFAFLFGSAQAIAATKTASSPPASDVFFIVSSVNLPQHQIVLKEPTEVTELVQFDEHSVILDEQGKRIEPSALRAGDTVFVSLSKRGGGIPLVTEIRKGEMTTSELHKRYVRFQ